MRSALILCLLSGACTTVSGGADITGRNEVSALQATMPLPKGAKRGASGFATIGAVPPSALPKIPPPMPTSLDTLARQTSMGSPEEQAAAWERANGTAEFQREFQRLRAEIESAEAGNFSTVRLVRDPGVMGEFVFYRDGPATLAKYTSDPRFRAVTTGVDAVDLAELQQLWSRRMEEEASTISMMGSDGEGRLELAVGIEEAEFRQLAREKGWDISDPRLDFRFPGPRPQPFLAPALESLVRFFPRENNEAAIRLTALGRGRVVLEDGCFRMADARGRPGESLVMFARDSQLGLDEQGYLVVRTGNEDRVYRIGEPGSWGGPNGYDEDSEDVRALRKACGNDEIVNIAAPQSSVLFAAPDPSWVLDYAYTKDITYERAWARVISCMERQIERGREPMDARDRCVQQYNGWDYRGEELPPPPGQ